MIKAKYPEIPMGTIQSTIRLEKKRKNNASRPRSGRPRGLMEEQQDGIYELTITEPHAKIQNIADYVDNAVCIRSIQRLLHEMD
jgi:transposase